MTKIRIQETAQSIEGEYPVAKYDELQRYLRDKGVMPTSMIILSGINQGAALEIGPGPGYLGLEWLKNTTGTVLTGVEISKDMIRLANKNAAEYELSDRATYVEADACELPFPDNSFDAVFTNESLHEWSDPVKVFKEIHRVLKPGGSYYISDLKRNLNWFIKQLMYYTVRPKEIRPGFVTSVRAAYTEKEISEMLARTNLSDPIIYNDPFGIEIKGKKN